MVLMEKLNSAFKPNTPIFMEEIQTLLSEYSRPRIYQFIAEAVKSGTLIRYDNGVYYIPTKTLLGVSKLNPQKIIEKKYIGSGDSVCGIYGGTLLLNSMGVTTQVPNVIEIFTNNETMRRREVMIGYQKVVLRKSRMPITAKNVELFRLMEFFNSIDINKMDKDTSFAGVVSYIRENGLARDEIIEYAQNFPAKAVKNLLQSGVLYEIA